MIALQQDIRLLFFIFYSVQVRFDDFIKKVFSVELSIALFL